MSFRRVPYLVFRDDNARFCVAWLLLGMIGSLLLTAGVALAQCNSTDLESKNAERCSRAYSKALLACVKRGTALAECDTSKSDQYCSQISATCLPKLDVDATFATVYGASPIYDECKQGLAGQAVRLLFKRLSLARKGRPELASKATEKCIALSQSKCGTVPALSPPCAEPNSMFEASLCACTKPNCRAIDTNSTELYGPWLRLFAHAHSLGYTTVEFAEQCGEPTGGTSALFILRDPSRAPPSDRISLVYSEEQRGLYLARQGPEAGTVTVFDDVGGLMVASGGVVLTGPDGQPATQTNGRQSRLRDNGCNWAWACMACTLVANDDLLLCLESLGLAAVACAPVVGTPAYPVCIWRISTAPCTAYGATIYENGGDLFDECPEFCQSPGPCGDLCSTGGWCFGSNCLSDDEPVPTGADCSDDLASIPTISGPWPHCDNGKVVRAECRGPGFCSPTAEACPLFPVPQTCDGPPGAASCVDDRCFGVTCPVDSFCVPDTGVCANCLGKEDGFPCVPTDRETVDTCYDQFTVARGECRNEICTSVLHPCPINEVCWQPINAGSGQAWCEKEDSNPDSDGGGGEDGEAVSTGDPNLSTFDKLGYGFQAVGEFVLLRSDDLEIQARQAPVGDYLSLNSAVAVRVGEHRVGVYGQGRVRVDGVDLPRGNAVGFPEGGAVIHGERIRVVSPVTDVIDILPLSGSRRWLNLNVRIDSNRAGQVSGLLGNFDGNHRNDLALRDGRVLAQPVSFAMLYSEFADSWRVTDEDSLFDYEPGESTATFTDRSFPPEPARVESFSASVRSAAEEACLAAGVTDLLWLNACIIDVASTGDPSFAAGYVGLVLPAEWSVPRSLNILVIEYTNSPLDSSSTALGTASALRSIGHAATVVTHLDAASLQLNDFDVVVLESAYYDLGYYDASYDMPVALQVALGEYVSGGGGLVVYGSVPPLPVGLLLGMYSDQGLLQDIEPLLPARALGVLLNDDWNDQYVEATSDPVVNSGLQPTIMGVPPQYLTDLDAKPGATIYYADQSSSVGRLVGWDYGAGRVITFSAWLDFSAGATREDWGPLLRLLSNSLESAARPASE